MPTLGEIISKTSSNYFIQDNNVFLDLLAYYLRADCECISLSCLYRNDKIDRIVIKTNSNNKKDLEEVYENILKIIEFIKDLLKNFDSELNEIYKDFIEKIMKYKLPQDPDLLEKAREKARVINKKLNKNNLYKVISKNWQEKDDDLSNLIKLRWELFLKLIDDCKNVKFSMENIDKLFELDARETGEIKLNTQLIHSELLVLEIMNYYYNKNDLQFTFEDCYYIGSNFKNCPCCNILINILNDNNEEKINTNGCHLKYYPWPFPPIMKPDDYGYDLLKKFFERLTLTSYNDSDNDDEVQFQDENRKYDALKDQVQYIISEKARKNKNKDVIESTIDWNDIFQKRMNYLKRE